MSYVLIIVLVGMGQEIRIAPNEMGIAERYPTQEACIKMAEELEHMKTYDAGRFDATCIPRFPYP